MRVIRGSISLGLFFLFFRGLAAPGAGSAIQEFLLPAIPGVHDVISFYYRMPESPAPPRGVLLLVPGYNGSGLDFLKASSSWYGCADSERLILVSPSFQTTPEEIHSDRGYYSPRLWSGQAALEAVDHIAAQAGISPGPILIFGFSAGAHFAHRFALWNPARVRAFVAYSAGWWDTPTDRLKGVPALIMCGESDPRYDATYNFFEKGLALGLPWMWRAYPDTGHQLTPAVTRMAQAFLGFYAATRLPEHWIGDAQTYRFYADGADDVQFIPKEAKIEIPSKSIAAIWAKEQ
jgi:pimeloyl-ACP methyl ester carboxylesterase